MSEKFSAKVETENPLDTVEGILAVLKEADKKLLNRGGKFSSNTDAVWKRAKNEKRATDAPKTPEGEVVTTQNIVHTSIGTLVLKPDSPEVEALKILGL